MPSRALTVHLEDHLRDPEELDKNHAKLRTGGPGRQHGLAALNRAMVVMSVSAWEAFVEELVIEAVDAIRPASPAMGVWPPLYAKVAADVRRFHTPNADNVRRLVRDAVGLPDVTASWSWQRSPAVATRTRLDQILTLRHEIAHGVNPRPGVRNSDSSGLPDFFRRLGKCTDAAVRAHLVDTLGVPNPWPA